MGKGFNWLQRMPRLKPLTVCDVSRWQPVGEEPRGKRAKFWVHGANADWLRKEPRDLRPTEPAIETLTLRLAQAAGIPAAESELAVWAPPQGGSKGGIVVKRFLDEKLEALLEGIQLLGENPSYNPKEHGEHTPERVRNAARRLERQEAELTQPLCDMLFFDAWIGNSDRHQQNWGIIKDLAGEMRVAPMYDTAACLGVELPSGHPLFRVPADDPRLAKYILGCGSGFGAGGRKTISQRQLLEKLRFWPEWPRSRERLMPVFAELLNEHLSDYLSSIMPEWLPTERLDFVNRLLGARLRWLESLP